MNSERMQLRTRHILVSIWIMLASSQVAGERDVRFVAQIGGACTAVEVAGNYAYVGQGPNLTIVDISNPADPIARARVLLPVHAIDEISVTRQLVYVATRSIGLVIVDVSSPSLPRVVAQYSERGADDIHLSGSRAYLNGRSDFLILDISNISSPSLLGRIQYAWAESTFVLLNLAYLQGVDNTLEIVNVSDPSSPTQVGLYDLPGEGRDIFCQGNFAYMGSTVGMHILDVSDPSSPTLSGFYACPGVYGISVSQPLAYVASGGSSPGVPRGMLSVVDVSNPSSPTLVGSFRSDTFLMRDVFTSGGLAYLAAGSEGLLIVDVTAPTSPTLLGQFLTVGGAYDVAVRGGIAYLADWTAGLSIFDVSYPYRPKLLGRRRLPVESCQVCISGDLAFVAQGGSGKMSILDVSDPRSPSVLGVYETTGTLRSVAVSNGRAYLAQDYHFDWLGSFHVVDVSDPSSPTRVGWLATAQAFDIAIASPTLICLSDVNRLNFIDVSSPSAPFVRSVYHDGGTWTARQVACDSNRAYVYRDWLDHPWPPPIDHVALNGVDFANPDAPRPHGSYTVGGSIAGGVYVSGDLVYAILGSFLRIFNTKSLPWQEVGSFNLNSGGTFFYGGVAVEGDYVYVAHADSGLWILHFPQPRTGDSSWTLYR